MIKVDLIRWLIGGLLFLLFVWVVVIQAIWIWKVFIKKEKVGGIIEAIILGVPSGLISFLILPIPTMNKLWWVVGLLNFAVSVYLIFIFRWLWGRFIHRQSKK